MPEAGGEVADLLDTAGGADPLGELQGWLAVAAAWSTSPWPRRLSVSYARNTAFVLSRAAGSSAMPWLICW
ncbi:hypothetical protein [Kitasatospora atroaurantiaca]|uniref:hypothetical protein n=1 Tax=Kitasatospora atroaurantiaca TaxID=285545 RepID=UPI0011A46684|nr:hypothetical protein [Kitasatospora atroaurantiaca]